MTTLAEPTLSHPTLQFIAAPRVLVVIPAKLPMPRSIFIPMYERLASLMAYSGASLYMDTIQEPKRPDDNTPWSSISRVRNNVLDRVNWRDFTHLLWIDADVVNYPHDLIEKLLARNFGGVSSPAITIEGRPDHFYDWAAFIFKGKSDINPHDRRQHVGRNINSLQPWGLDGEEMDCVGTVTLVNTDIYRDGARYADHPAFTDHFPICERARQMGRKVTIHADIVAEHADLPKHGLEWH